MTTPQDLYAHPDYKEFASFDADAIKTSIATVAAPASYSGADLNGVLATPGPAVIDAGSYFLQRVTATLSASVGSYVASNITITGTDAAGAALVDTMAIPDADGGVTIQTSAAFLTVVSIDIAAMVNTSGAFTFGVGDVVVSPAARAVQAVGAGTLSLLSGEGIARSLTFAAGDYRVGALFEVKKDTTALPFSVWR